MILLDENKYNVDGQGMRHLLCSKKKRYGLSDFKRKCYTMPSYGHGQFLWERINEIIVSLQNISDITFKAY